MARTATERTAAFVRDRIGDGLRTVVLVTENDWETAYLRDDLKTVYDRRTYSEVVDAFRLQEGFMSPNIDGHPVGERRALVHYHESAFVLQFPFSETETILVSVTNDAGRDLMGFIETVRQVVEGESPAS